MRMVLTAAVFILLSIPLKLGAQRVGRDRISVEAKGYAGYLFDNRVELDSHLYGSADLAVGFTPSRMGTDAYAKAYGYPTCGLGMCVSFLSDIEVPGESYFGNYYSAYGFFRRNLFEARNLTAGYMIEIGPAFNPVRYDPVINPDNIYVSSFLMVHAAAGAYVRYRFLENWEIGLAVRAKHHSNGRSALPNYGQNMIEGGLSLAYLFGAEEADAGEVMQDEKPSFDKGFQYHLTISGGAHCTRSDWKRYNLLVPDSSDKQDVFKAYPRFAFSADVMYRYALKCSTGISLDAFVVPDIKTLEKNDRFLYGDKAVDEGPGYSPVFFGISLVQEFYYRNLALHMALGFYPVDPRLGLSCDVSWNYQKAGLRYYIPAWNDMFIGMAVKANDFSESEMVEFSIGIRL